MKSPMDLPRELFTLVVESSSGTLKRLFLIKIRRLFCICGGGYRSALAAANLKEMGYVHVCSMEGGIKAWRQAGLPLEGETESPSKG